jgi:hypothetical protein
VALARVTTFEGGTPEGVRAAVERLQSDVDSGPPEGVKSTGLTVLADPDGGRTMFIGLFASEDDLRSSEAALEQMNPPEGMGQRASVEVWKLPVDVRM